MHDFLQAVRRLEVHSRIAWKRPRVERTLTFASADELVRVMERLAGEARELEVFRKDAAHYVLYVRD